MRRIFGWGVLAMMWSLALCGRAARADGLAATYYDNPDFSGLQVSRVDATIDFDWAEGAPFSNFGVNDFSTRWTGFIKPAYSGTYTFYLSADDGCRLSINNVSLIDDWAFNYSNSTRTATISLNADTLYPIQVEYLENSGWAGVRLEWSSASQARQVVPSTRLFSSAPSSSGGSGLLASYWDNADFSGPGFMRVDTNVNFDWRGGSPDARIAADTFSARWTGLLCAPSTGAYTFTTATDDGVRLWVNNTLLVDRWNDQGPTNWSGTINLVAGRKYALRMDYYENGGGAVARLAWSGPGFASQIVPASVLFPLGGYAGATALFGVNLAGAEQNLGKPYYDYPNTRNDGSQSYTRSLDYYVNRGRRVVRVPFLWERMQPALMGALSDSETAKLDSFLAEANARGMLVILDCHNYGSYYGNRIGTANVPYAAFAYFWKRMAQRYAGQSVIYGYDLMNEPVEFATANDWPQAAQAAITAIRSADTGTAIFVEGDAYSHAWEWPTKNGALINLQDPANNLVFEAHEYFDPDGNGDYLENIAPPSAQDAINRVKPFVDWCKAKGVRGFLGEYAVPNTAPGSRIENDAGWNAMMNGLLSYLKSNGVGGTYWAGGPRWDPSERISIEPLLIDPANIAGTADRGQMSVLRTYPGGY